MLLVVVVVRDPLVDTSVDIVDVVGAWNTRILFDCDFVSAMHAHAVQMLCAGPLHSHSLFPMSSCGACIETDSSKKVMQIGQPAEFCFIEIWMLTRDQY